MWVLFWTLGSAFFLGLLGMSGLSSWDRWGFFVAAVLAGVNGVLAARRDAKFIELRRRWKERRARQRHTEVRGDIAIIGAKIDEGVQQILASVTRDAETAVAREDTEEAKAFRRAEYERIMEAFHEIIALYDNAQTYGKLATDTLRDIGKIVVGSRAETVELQILLGLPVPPDEQEEELSAQSKVDLIYERVHLYHREHVKKIRKDKLLMPEPPPLLPPSQSGEPIPMGTPLGDIGANED
jgi:hypothetical protein